MPRRREFLVNNEVYHIFNRGIAGSPIFRSLHDYNRMIKLIEFYTFDNLSLRFSHYNRLPKDLKGKFLKNLHDKNERLVNIYAFVLMPNHFHFQLRQIRDSGIVKFIGNLQNAYARFFNTKYKSAGSLFQLRYKAVRVEGDEQLVHLNRYIHINPLTSFILNDPKDLEDYKWSSFPSYIAGTEFEFLNTDFVLKTFGGTKNDFIKFTLNQVDYQRKLAKIKRLTLE